VSDALLKTLARIEKSVRASDGEAILARWDFGHAVLEQRQGKQLPKGLLAEICERTGLHHTEVSFRVRVAEHYERSQLETLVSSSSPTWTAIRDGLPKKRPTPKAQPKPEPPPAQRTKTTIAKADRVAALIVEPDVAAELSRRAADDEAARKAQKLAEKQQRQEAKAQKERDQETQQRQQVLRSRLVRGDADWQNLTEQMETMADTVTRLVALLDGLPIPDELHRKIFERHLSAAQQALYELRLRVTPQHHGKRRAAPARTDVIEAMAR
jgi:hypothetical protein